MASPQEQAQCGVWLTETKSPITVQRKFRSHYGKKAPDVKLIRTWMETFLATESIQKRTSSRRSSVLEETVQAVQTAFRKSPQKSTRQASRELQVPKSTVHKLVRKCLKLYVSKVQIVQALQPDDHPKRKQFAKDMLNHLNEDNDFWKRMCFSDEATFHVSG